MIDLHDHFIQQFQTQGSKKGIKITKQHQPTKRKKDFCLQRATKEDTHLSVSASSGVEQEDFVRRNRKGSLIVLFRIWNPRVHGFFFYCSNMVGNILIPQMRKDICPFYTLFGVIWNIRFHSCNTQTKILIKIEQISLP